ncbi:uncharacterized protein [Garra rufa]|uniref:uncharacterized protein n=1 Tax=Garra rufa TaxID=137080 RepID=UPI003CCE7871
MTDSPEKNKVASLTPDLNKIIEHSTKIEEGAPTQYHLEQNAVEEFELFKTMTYGKRDSNKPHKTILMVGETGTGKTKLINALINYKMGVQSRDKVWYEFTDDPNNRTSAQSQTSIITVYGIYLQVSPIHLTIIDTPGYGDMHAVNEKEIAMSLLKLSGFDYLLHKIDAVCLVIKATQNRLSDRQIYIFDAIQSLFGKDVVENIVLLVTFSHGAHPKNALTAVKEAKFQCAVNDKNEPVYFLFDNCQGETFHEEYQNIQEQSWNISFGGMRGFFAFLDKTKPKPLMITQDVLQQREQLEETILKIKSHTEMIKEKNNSKVEVTYKEKVQIDTSKASMAMCCTVCQENCHYPGCWWVRDLSWCSVMKNNHCTVCTNKCHYTKHIKEDKIYKTTKEMVTNKDFKKNVKIVDGESLLNNLEEELQELKLEKMKLVIEAFHCVKTLGMIALNTDSLITLQHVDFLIHELKEIKEPEKAETLENIKKRAGEEKNKVLEYMKMYYK